MCKSKQGFTLIEFLVAIVILMVGLLGLLQTVNVALQHNLNSELRGESVAIADGLMAKELSKGFDMISTTTKNMADSRRIRGAFKSYSAQRTGSTLSYSKQISIQVWWKHKGATYSHETNSIVSKTNQ